MSTGAEFHGGKTNSVFLSLVLNGEIPISRQRVKIASLKLTAKGPENRPGPKRKLLTIHFQV